MTDSFTNDNRNDVNLYSQKWMAHFPGTQYKNLTQKWSVWFRYEEVLHLQASQVQKFSL